MCRVASAIANVRVQVGQREAETKERAGVDEGDADTGEGGSLWG